ncbi:triacylglycerol lipase [Oesophagostomum dentatum]|uniref:Triacylglycerol lipase n=1 Tax=Oesophagostomum dentatum TaxID=61180 RepID=A0A0B1T252_OESDE|nr:triacylglycerol lipase [Oesophagostomum dentatum]
MLMFLRDNKEMKETSKPGFTSAGLVSTLLNHGSRQLMVTGYSLGGSLASMTALYVARKDLVDKNLLRLITFGEPRTGNVAFAQAIEKYVKFRYRVVKGDDFVSCLLK